MPAFIVFKELDDATCWQPLNSGVPVEAANADAAIETARTTAGTFVAVLVRGFRPRTHYAAPKPPAKPKETI